MLAAAPPADLVFSPHVLWSILALAAALVIVIGLLAFQNGEHVDPTKR